MAREGPFSSKIWGLLSLELWQQQFHDQPLPMGQLEGIG